MNCLIVNAHPLENSLCNKFSTRIHDQLVRMGYDVWVQDLYKNKFDPVLSVQERQTYYQLPYDNSGVKKQQEDLLNTDILILVFPTWWFGFPAIMKGWFDRVWSPGTAYDHASDYGPIQPRLNRLKKVFAVTTLGAPWWVDYLVLRRPVKRILNMALLKACAKNSHLKFISFYKCEQVNPDRLKKFLLKIENDLNHFLKTA